MEKLSVGDVLISKRDGTRYTIDNVRMSGRECGGSYAAYSAVDANGWFITVYESELDRFDVIRTYDIRSAYPEAIERIEYGYRSWSPEERAEYDRMYDR